MALTSCTVPAAGKPTFELGEDEMEIGIGIHGEPGRRRVPLRSAREIAEQLMEPILADLDFRPSPVIVMLNGMGGTPPIELYLMYGEVAKIMEKAGSGGSQSRRKLHHIAGDGRLLGHCAARRTTN